MSGGFFRGTSADQDTRFSNKQAKLLKSQKFAPELEILVDMTRIKMDVMRPWIAKRVTELIGFEDEVLINFIYGLLEGKAVNGKQVQISLTGFMERNTGKFMKELWVLLLSAQQNVSGVPQQFLDAKEEETKKRLAETDRIASEIRKKKDKELQEAEQEKIRMDGNITSSRDQKTEAMSNSGHDRGMQREDEREKFRGRGDRMRSRLRTSYSPNHSPSPRRKHSASPSKSSGSERRKSRSGSRGRSSRSPAVPSQGQRRSPPRKSLSPYRKHAYRRSPSPRHRSSYSRRAQYRDDSPRRHRSRSPVRYRSRSSSPRRSRRSTRRSPVSYRFRTPLRHRSRSPVRRRDLSQSPRRRSPDYRGRKLQSPENGSSLSPVQHLPSSRQRHPSPRGKHHQDSSPSPPRRSESPAPHRSASHRRSRSPGNGRSLSPKGSPSPAHMGITSPSLVKRGSTKSTRRPSEGERTRIHEKRSPEYSSSPTAKSDAPAAKRRVKASTADSPQRDVVKQDDSLRKRRELPPRQRSPDLSDASRSRSPSEERLPPSDGSHKKRNELSGPDKLYSPRKSSANRPDRVASVPRISAETNISRRDAVDHKFTSSEIPQSDDRANPGKTQPPSSEALHDMEDQGKHHKRQSTVQGKEWDAEDNKSSRKDAGSDLELEPEADDTPAKSKQREKNGPPRLPSEEIDERRDEGGHEKRKHKKSDEAAESDDESSYDSYEERREAKKRRKERKRLEKEDRRRRREQKRLAREERRAEKHKPKSRDDSNAGARQRGSNLMDADDTDAEQQQRKLEIELREKALESLRAKKSLGS